MIRDGTLIEENSATNLENSMHKPRSYQEPKLTRRHLLDLAAAAASCAMAAAAAIPMAATAQPLASGSGRKGDNHFRLSWLTTIGNHGPIVEVMKRTNVLSNWGVSASYAPFPIAGPAASAAAAGEIDIFWGADLGVWGINSQGFDWVAIAANNGWRFGIATRKGSGINSIGDLKGKTVGYPFSTGTGKYLEDILAEQNLKVGVDFKTVNVPVSAVQVALTSGQVDAVGAWDPPMITQLSGEKLLAEGYTGPGRKRPGTVFAVKADDVKRRPEMLIRFLCAYIDAQWYAITHLDQVIGWFAQESRFTPELLRKSIENDSMYSAKKITDINIAISPEMLQTMQQNVQYFVNNGQLKKVIDPRNYVNTSLVQQAQERIAKSGPSAIIVNR